VTGSGDLEDPVAREYLAWCEREQEPANTIRRRRTVLRAVGCPSTITREEIETWWFARGHLAKSSRANELAILRSFYTWCAIWEKRLDDPTVRLKAPKGARGLPRPATDREWAQLLAHMAALPRRGAELTRAIKLGAWAGVRVSEAANLAWPDIDVDRRQARVTGKGGKTRLVSLTEQLLKALGPDHGGNVVTGRPDGWTGDTLRKYVNAEIHAAVGPHVTFHKLRHRYGTRAYRKTKDPIALAEQMGHASPSTAMTFYASAADDAGRQIADAAADDD
jgi:integrase/recombinase XerC